MDASELKENVYEMQTALLKLSAAARALPEPQRQAWHAIGRAFTELETAWNFLNRTPHEPESK